MCVRVRACACESVCLLVRVRVARADHERERDRKRGVHVARACMGAHKQVAHCVCVGVCYVGAVVSCCAAGGAKCGAQVVRGVCPCCGWCWACACALHARVLLRVWYV